MQLCKYADMQVYRYANIQVYKYVSMELYKFMSKIVLIKEPPQSIIDGRGDRNLSPSVCNYPPCRSPNRPGKLDKIPCKITHCKIVQAFIPCSCTLRLLAKRTVATKLP